MNFFGALPTMLSAPFTFMIFVYSADFAEHGLSSARAFTTLTLLGLLTSPLEKILKSIPVFTATFGCLDRIQAYLLLEVQADVKVLEARSEEKRRPTPSSTSSSSDVTSVRLEAEKMNRPPSRAVVLDDVTVRYGSGDSAAVLDNFSLSLDDGQVVMVVGPVGCGKSTLLKTVVGDLVVARGSLWRRDPEAAYCQQTPWLTNGTVRDNIVGQSLDDDDAWYGTVRSACGLDEDVSGWPDGDDTKIGSGGIACSGGQKQRLVSTTLFRPRPCRKLPG